MLSPVSNTYSLKQDHQYYYQVQFQLFICGGNYAHFLVWTPKETHIETILSDKSFFGRNVPKSETFSKLCILPEVLAKYFTREII